MTIEVIAKALKELGHPTRLTVFKRLVQSGRQGIAVGILQQELEVPGSTLSHHISSLVSANLIVQRREGRTLFCVVNYERLQAVIAFFQNDCCIDAQ
ncbi:MAG: helix-turn-helix transcriptional regulator [Colwellia sp.]|nr:helix-turn-helix transcriptional regulator [Colwellia sp.]